MERATMELLILLDGGLGLLERDFDPVAPGDPVAELERLGELIARLEIEDERLRGDRREPVDDRAALRAEGRRHRQPSAECLHPPADDLRGLRPFQRPTGGRQGLWRDRRRGELAAHGKKTRWRPKNLPWQAILPSLLKYLMNAG